MAWSVCCGSLLQSKTGRKSEQLSRERLALLAAEEGLVLPEPEGH
jgi:hypothetical protein